MNPHKILLCELRNFIFRKHLIQVHARENSRAFYSPSATSTLCSQRGRSLGRKDGTFLILSTTAICWSGKAMGKEKHFLLLNILKKNFLKFLLVSIVFEMNISLVIDWISLDILTLRLQKRQSEINNWDRSFWTRNCIVFSGTIFIMHFRLYNKKNYNTTLYMSRGPNYKHII